MKLIGDIVDFGKALEALKDDKKIRRPTWDKTAYLFYDPDKKIIFDQWTNGTQLFNPTQTEVLADDWEIVPDTPERSPEEVLSEFRSWLDKSIHCTCGTPGNGHPYLIQCLDKLDELSSSKPVKIKLPVKGEVVYISGNEGVVRTEYHKLVIIQLPGVNL